MNEMGVLNTDIRGGNFTAPGRRAMRNSGGEFQLLKHYHTQNLKSSMVEIFDIPGRCPPQSIS